MCSTKSTLVLSLMLALMMFVVPSPKSAIAGGGFKGTWKKVSNKDGVLVHRMKLKGSNLFAFRGEMTANIHIAKLIRIFISPKVKTRKKWIDGFRGSKPISTPSPLERVYWIRFDLPWPAWDRDFVFHTRAVPNLRDRTFTALIKSVKHKKFPKNKCCVRAFARGTYYKFTALKHKKGDKRGPRTRLYVEVHTDPKGWLPAWLINKTQSNWPRKTLLNLVKVSRKAKPHPLMLPWHSPGPIQYPAAVVKKYGKLIKASQKYVKEHVKPSK
ncbi:MAG: hypothetical protein EP343_24770 [Deltaproteobacteria bacterium]|nr:MAG: hypothetical protein EP343_24770 [Deltaproteobacteria bacterium]